MDTVLSRRDRIPESGLMRAAGGSSVQGCARIGVAASDPLSWCRQQTGGWWRSNPDESPRAVFGGPEHSQGKTFVNPLSRRRGAPSFL